MSTKSDNRFRFLIYLTILLTYLVILAGAVVRTTQSGMGCPDWPKCFGSWVPPTDASQLPANYHEIYAHRGYADTTFDAYHTWVEYVNRLLGALLGLVIFLALTASFSYRKTKAQLFWLTFSSFILVGFQGWLGSLVVASNLAPVKITVHMLAALILLALLIYIHHLASSLDSFQIPFKKLKNWMYVAVGLTIFQVLMGTQVRQEVDIISLTLQHVHRETWADKLSYVFKIHRTFSILVFLLNAWIIVQVIKSCNAVEKIKFQSYLMGLVLSAELLAGFILSHYDFPSALQPLHLILASLLFGIQVKLLLLLAKKI